MGESGWVERGTSEGVCEGIPRVGMMAGRCGVYCLPDDPVVVSDCKLGAPIRGI